MRVIRRGRSVERNFSDAVWGGRDLALVAAQRFRDELLHQRVGPDSRERRRVPKGSRSVTGVVGVSLETHVVEGRVYHRYVGHWREADRRTKRRRFLVERYGRKQAKALAMRARKVGVAHSHAERLARQREEAARRLQKAPPMPSQVKDPLSRKGISMARRRPRRVN